MKKTFIIIILLAVFSVAKADLVVDSLGTVRMDKVVAGTITGTVRGSLQAGNVYVANDRIINVFSGESIKFHSYRGIYYSDFASESLFDSQRPQYGFSVASRNAFTAYFYNGNDYPYPVITAQSKTNQGTLFFGRNASNAVTSQIKTDGTIIATSFQTTGGSILRNTRSLSNILEEINRLNPITYTIDNHSSTVPIESTEQRSESNEDTEGLAASQSPLYDFNTEILTIMEAEQQRPKYGFVAQELEKIFPNVVYTMSTGEKAIAYQELIPILVSAIQEQQELIDNLVDEVEALKQPVAPQRQQAPAAMQEAIAVGEATLMQNTPNPFNQATEIGYRLPEGTATAMIMLCDMNGKMLQTYPLAVNDTAGTLTIQAGSYTPGMYLYTLLIDGVQIDTKQMIILAH